MQQEAKLQACIATRKLAADALAKALRKLLPGSDPISEIDLRDLWLANMRQNPQIHPDGWYTPPPHGMAVLFGTDTDTSRTNYDALRTQKMWSREDIFLDRKKGVIMVYASPVDRTTHTIGDFEMMLYFGDNTAVQDHFRKTLELDKKLFDQVEIGMTLGEVAKMADKLMSKFGLSNNVVSLNDPTGTNIGHTIPATDADWTKEEKSTFGQDDWNKTKDVIAKKRRFVNKSEDLKIQPGLAFTIEPRPIATGHPEIPMASFHTTAVVHSDGRKEWLTNFDELFKIADMDEMADLS